MSLRFLNLACESILYNCVKLSRLLIYKMLKFLSIAYLRKRDRIKIIDVFLDIYLSDVLTMRDCFNNSIDIDIRFKLFAQSCIKYAL